MRALLRGTILTGSVKLNLNLMEAVQLLIIFMMVGIQFVEQLGDNANVFRVVNN